MSSKVFKLFEVVGVEIEYMVVDKESLHIRPIVDEILFDLAGNISNEIVFDKVGVSNELVSHVIELKMSSPQVLSEHSHLDFHEVIKYKIQPVLDKNQSLLLPSSMHPTLHTNSPLIKIWQHGNKEIYKKYDAIFGCHGHGFSNIQSVHLNLPFSDNEEFVLLHQAIRLILPLIPALSASSPIVEGRQTNALDNRLLYYKNNQKKIPIISGEIIPESIDSIADYFHKILNPIEKALSPFNHDNILEAEWVNSRGAIARFERNAIEIRLMDSQESPLADFACVSAINAILKDLIYHHPINPKLNIAALELKRLMMNAAHQGMSGTIEDKAFLGALSLAPGRQYHFRTVLDVLIERASQYIEPCYLEVLEHMLKFGNLAERMIKFLDPSNAKQNTLNTLLHALSGCLLENKLF